jgi:glycosyltransferase involved in cell wall biosynthesis
VKAKDPMGFSPLVSVVLPFYNAQATLAAAIRSILFQSYGHWELILLDDGSTDNSLCIAENVADPRIKIISGGYNRRLPRRLNQGVAFSQGEYIARMDADDIAYPDRLATQVAFLENHPQIDLLGSRVLIFEEGGKIVGTYPFQRTHVDICSRPWAGFYLAHPTWMGKARWFKENPYQLNATRIEDQDLLLRTFKTSQFACLPEILMGYRQSALSLKNVLMGRYHFSKALVKNRIGDKGRIIAWGVAGQAAKALIDTFAITTGLTYRILKHRALPVSTTDVDAWHRIWQRCA